MVAPPKYAKSVEVHNATAAPVAVKVTYQADDKEIEVTHEVGPNASFNFPEKTVDMGSWQAVAPVKHVSTGSWTTAPSVSGVVDKVVFTCNAHGLTQQPR